MIKTEIYPSNSEYITTNVEKVVPLICISLSIPYIAMLGTPRLSSLSTIPLACWTVCTASWRSSGDLEGTVFGSGTLGLNTGSCIQVYSGHVLNKVRDLFKGHQLCSPSKGLNVGSVARIDHLVLIKGHRVEDLVRHPHP